MRFEPKCYVCRGDIEDPSKAHMACDNFARKLPWLLSDELKYQLQEIEEDEEEDEEEKERKIGQWIVGAGTDLANGFSKDFVNMITNQYFHQFRKTYRPEEDGPRIVRLGEFWEDERNFARAHEMRAREVLRKKNHSFLFIPTHDKCMEEYFDATYHIRMDNLSTPSKALEWSFQMNEKNWFNPHNWLNILEGIYGRGSFSGKE